MQYKQIKTSSDLSPFIFKNGVLSEMVKCPIFFFFFLFFFGGWIIWLSTTDSKGNNFLSRKPSMWSVVETQKRTNCWALTRGLCNKGVYDRIWAEICIHHLEGGSSLSLLISNYLCLPYLGHFTTGSLSSSAFS